MDALSPSDFQSAWAVLMATCAAIVAVGGAAAILVKLYRWVTAPTREQAEHIAELKEHDQADYQRIEALEAAVEKQGEQSRLMLQGLMQLMTHEIDGNHVEQLRETRDKFEAYLIKRS